MDVIAARFLAATWPAVALTCAALLVLFTVPVAWRALAPDAQARLARANALPPPAPPLARALRARAAPLARLLWRVRRRIAAAGLRDRLSVAGVIALCAATALCGAGWAYVVVPAPPALPLGAAVGAVLPWIMLGRLASRWRILLDQQLARLLALWAANTAAPGTSPEQALRDLLRRDFSPPLSWYLGPVAAELEGARGLADRTFLQVLDHLASVLGSRPFRQARDAIEVSQTQRVALADALRLIAQVAASQLEFAAQTRATFAYSRAAAAAMFALPAIISGVLRLILPGTLEYAYSRPVVGWVAALGIAGWCVGGYLFVAGGARRAQPLWLADEADDGAGDAAGEQGERP